MAADLRHPRARPSRHGLTLFELLIALVICAALLTATAVALNASFKAYSVNQVQSDLTQRARVAVHRICAEIRQTADHAPVTASAVNLFAAGANATDSGIAMFRADGTLLTIRHDAAGQRLVMERGGQSYTMLEGVTAFSVSFSPMYQQAESFSRRRPVIVLQRASVTLTVRTRGNAADVDEAGNPITVTINASASPRQNVW
jgi:prepilin-type N-terminal cleavage/methylation domain-containing protein